MDPTKPTKPRRRTTNVNTVAQGRGTEMVVVIFSVKCVGKTQRVRETSGIQVGCRGKRARVPEGRYKYFIAEKCMCQHK
jgi:hypothetical protein